MRTAGQALTDSSGRVIGHYHVWLRDNLTLLSFGRIGNTRKTIEVRVKKAEFPSLPKALTLDGPIGVLDQTGSTLTMEVANNDDELDSRLKTVAGLESFVTGIAANATDIAPASIADYGGPSDYRVVVANGDVTLGSGVGYGILLARRNVYVTGNFTWNGLVIIIGQGALHWNAGAYGIINGGMFLARTRADDGTLLAERGGITADFGGAAGALNYDAPAIAAANKVFPYVPIAIRERN